MVDQKLQTTFEEVYHDDFDEADNYHRVLFNTGRAVQARELTQLQTIIQQEITRLGNNIFKEGASVEAAGVVAEPTEFVKISSGSYASLNALVGTKFAAGNVQANLYHVEDAAGGDPITLYLNYLASDQTGTLRFAPNTTVTSVSNPGVSFTVQTTDTTLNPATGQGLFIGCGTGSVYATGRFVHIAPQSKLISKYTTDVTDDIGFKIVEGIVTVDDTNALYDNSGDVPNLAAPGADRYQIQLLLDIRSNMSTSTPVDNFIYHAKLENGFIIDTVVSKQDNNYNVIGDMIARRTSEESGDYIVKPYRLSFADNSTDASKLDIKVSPGLAYVDGYRVENKVPEVITVDKPRTTSTVVDEVVPFIIGNYVLVDGSASAGIPDIDATGTVNLYNAVDAGGSIIGTARVRALDEDNGGNIRVHLYQISMNSAQNFRDVRSIGTGAGDHVDLVLEGGQAVIKEANNNSLVFRLPKQRPQSLASISLTVQRRFTGSITANKIDITASVGETFTNANDWFVSVDGGQIQSASVTINSATSASVTGLTGTSAEVLAYVRKPGSVASKTVSSNVTETIAPGNWVTANGETYFELANPDIYQFVSVTNASSGSDVSSIVTLDNGQRDNYYTNGRVVLRSGQSTPTYSVQVVYKHFNHTTGSFFAVNSYSSIDYEDIPDHTFAGGTTVNLRDCLDFRPVIDSGVVGVRFELLQSSDLVEADVTYYNYSQNKLVVDTAGQLKFISGNESLTPDFPAHPDNSLELYRITLAPYTLNGRDLITKQIEHRHYTMKDIGILEKRIDKLEELTSLSLIELDTANFKVLDASGNDRTKSGFFVDNFSTHLYSDTSNPNYRASLDPAKKALRPIHETNAVDLAFADADVAQSNVVRKGDNIYLYYDEQEFINQNVASRLESVMPLWSIKFKGNLKLSPASDNWIERQYNPDQVVTVTILDTTGSLLWDTQTWNWGGTPLDQLGVGDTTQEVVLSQSSSSTTSGSRRFVNPTGSDWGFQQDVRTTTTTTNTTFGSNAIVGESTVSEIVNDNLLQTVTIPFMRSRKVYFKGEGFRPNTKLYPFFDGLDVSDWCREELFQNVGEASVQTTEGNVQSNALEHPEVPSELITDGDGVIEGSFYIPSTSNFRFNVGSKLFELIDVTSGDKDVATTFGQSLFTSSGVIEIRERDVLNTRTLEVQGTTRNTTTTRSTEQVIREDFFAAGDPLAQTFTIKSVNGVFATSIDLYFGEKSNDLPVWIMLKPVEDGYPADVIIPGSVVFKNHNEVETSVGGTVATTFTFDEPVYLTPGKEYAVMVQSNTPDYKVWVSRVGDNIIKLDGTPDPETKITKQPFLGVLFKSSNASTWTPSQWEDLKFKLNVAQFVTSGNARITNVNTPSKLLDANPIITTNGSAVVRVAHSGHGFSLGDKVTISGAISTGGISAGNINGEQNITAVDLTGYTFTSTVSATSDDIGGGSAVVATQNLLMDVAHLNIATLNPPQTNIQASAITITGESMSTANSASGTSYQVQSSVRFPLNRNVYFDRPMMVASLGNETASLSGAKSFKLDVAMTTEDPFVSPIIDMQRAALITVSNQIDNQVASTPDSTQNVPLSYAAETSASGGTHGSKHITTPITLTEDAVGLKILVSANKPNEADFEVYYRTAPGDEDIGSISWTLTTPETPLIGDSNPNTFREYRYLVGGTAGTLDSFNKFQIKIVMKSSNSSKVPVFRDLRTIALGV